MGETLDLTEQEGAVEGKEEHVYDSIPEFLSAFEESEPFKEALEERRQALKAERPELELEEKDLVYGLRLTPS